jgi:hypothetical protein
MRPLTRRSLQLAMLATLAGPSLASADPIRITSGFVQAGALDPRAQFALAGDGFSLTGFAQSLNSTVSLRCVPCVAGTALDLAGEFHGPDAAGSGVVDGVTYSEIFLNGMTATFSSPSFQLSGDQTVTIVRDFTFTGTIRGYLLNPFVYGFTEPAFTKTLTGQGIVRGEFLVNADEPPLFFSTGLRYEFTGQDPVPEPGTLVLLGSGAALVALRRRRRLRATRSSPARPAPAGWRHRRLRSGPREATRASERA